MKKIFSILFINLLFNFGYSNYNCNDSKNEKKILELVLLILQKTHYNPFKIDDKFSKNMYREYLHSLDKQKVYFLQSDIDEFSKYELKIDDQILKNDLSFFYLTYDRVIKRMKESKEIFNEISNGRIDIMTNEIINLNFENCKYSKDKNGITKKWLNQYKPYILQEILENEKSTNYQTLTLDQAEALARKKAINSLNTNQDNYENLNRVYFFSIFINTIIDQFDNHSEYIPSKYKAKFEAEMSGKIVGVGVKLEVVNGFISIKELAYGGPAWKSKKVDVGDQILKIQEEKGDLIDVVGYDQQDFVKRSKGKIGTLIKFTLKKEDGSIVIVPMKRAVIEIEDSYIKSAITNKNGKKFGIIDIPIFYKDFEDESARDAAKDFEKEIENLKKENVEGLVIDLRDNGGGSLDMSLQIASIFLGNSPIVQIKNADKSVQILSNTNGKILFDKPIVLLTNSNSASASELFAAAIQDYKRGIILGDKQTYGKGTTQNTLNLNDYNPKKDEFDFGVLKTTIQKYYRVSGESTQLKGVNSDVFLPNKFLVTESGEKYRSNILPWDKIAAITFKPLKSISNFDEVIKSSKNRILNSKNFDIVSQIKNAVFDSKEKNLLINFDIYKAEKQKFDSNIKNLEKSLIFDNFLEFKSTVAEYSLFKKLPTLETKRNQWHETMSKDIYINEALNILFDIETKF